MNAENLIPSITSMGGCFFIGVMLGYFVKKIIKVFMFVIGGILGLLLYLQQQQIILINIQKLEASSSFIVTTFGSSFNNVTHIDDTTSLGIPLALGLSAGLVVGFVKG
jgi:uncharacterized membrane protein (Fun14 family)